MNTRGEVPAVEPACNRTPYPGSTVRPRARKGARNHTAHRESTGQRRSSTVAAQRHAAMTIDYDAGQLTGWCGLPKLICAWKGTILHGALLGPMFWIVLGLHVVFLVLGGKLGEGGGWDLPKLPWSSAVIGLSLLFFFIVFYGNASYGRFYQLYGHTVGIGGTTMEWTALVKCYSASVPQADRPAAQWNAVRLILAATHLQYYTLHGEGISSDEWELIIMRGLLSEGEKEMIERYGGMKPFIAVCWALDHVQQMISHAATRSDAAYAPCSVSNPGFPHSALTVVPRASSWSCVWPATSISCGSFAKSASNSVATAARSSICSSSLSPSRTSTCSI